MISKRVVKHKGFFFLVLALIIGTTEAFSQTYKRHQIRLPICDSTVFFNHQLIPICTTRSRKLKPNDINKQADTLNTVMIRNQEFLYPKQNLGFKFRLITDDDFNPILDWHLKVLDSNRKTLFHWRPVYLWRCFLFVEISVFFHKRNTSVEKYKHTVVYEIK
jgi:hypothetical protein